MPRVAPWVALAALLAGTGAHAQSLDEAENAGPPAPPAGYLDSHREVTGPITRLGGGIEVTVEQQGGVVLAALPSKRTLDPHIFGTPDQPRRTGGVPIVNGIPEDQREETEDGALRHTQRRAYGNRHMTMLGEKLSARMLDKTGSDGAATRDLVEMKATWTDQDGNVYEVRCCGRVLTHGLAFPTLGGVVTNHLIHGFTGIGTPLMPTAFAQVAFWGMGDVRLNGRVLDKPRLVHGMLTEYTRKQGYELAHDDGLRPDEGRHFHIIVPEITLTADRERLEREPVDTGFTMENGEPLPFWHVMFERVSVKTGAP